jgi:hypothetical protein
MEHLSSGMEHHEDQEHQEYQQQQLQWRRGKIQSFAAKDTAKERYRKYCKLD